MSERKPRGRAGMLQPALLLDMKMPLEGALVAGSHSEPGWWSRKAFWQPHYFFGKHLEGEGWVRK